MHLSGDFINAPDETVQAPACAALPSGRAAYDLVDGDWSALAPVVGYTAARAALIAVGMVIAGEREHIIRNALAGAVGIEAFVLVWALIKKNGTT